MNQNQTATEKAPKVHLQVAMFTGVTRNTSRHYNLCNVLRGDFNGYALGLDPIHSEGTTGEITCPRCKALLADLGLALNHLIPLRPAVVAEQERAYAQRRLTWQLESLRQQAASLAASYRRMAENVDEHLARLDRLYQADVQPSAREGAALRFAIEMVHAQTWGIANTSIDTLLSRAAEVDQTAQEAK